MVLLSKVTNISPLLSLTGKHTAFSGFGSYYFCEEGNVQIVTSLFLCIKEVLKYSNSKTMCCTLTGISWLNN